jgi:hypothetical protein
MTPGRKGKVVVLGMMSKKPVAGIAFITMQYVIGLERLGYEAYYVEAHACTPTWFAHDSSDGSDGAAGYIDAVMRRFDLADRWAFHALHSDGRCYGMSLSALQDLYRSATWIFNLHGGTVPLPEHYEEGRLVYVGTDPVGREIEIHHGVQDVIDLLAPHCAFFTWGENHGNPDCPLPVSERFPFEPTRQPIVLDLWDKSGEGPADTFTTIGNWRQANSDIVYGGQLYTWSKHVEFEKFLDVPARTGQAFELALSSYTAEDRQLLEQHSWKVRDSMGFSTDLDAYRRYIAASRGEFTVAKDQNVRMRSGWFSDRSASYLASGRPVITQETGFSNILPTGEGLFGFSDVDEVKAAVDAINGDYGRHCQGALRVAREYFDYRVVLTGMLDYLGTTVLRPRLVRERAGLPASLSNAPPQPDPA